MYSLTIIPSNTLLHFHWNIFSIVYCWWHFFSVWKELVLPWKQWFHKCTPLLLYIHCLSGFILMSTVFYYITAMELVSSRNIEEMVLVLKKEVAKTHNVVEHEDTGKYRQLLVRTLHSCCIKVRFSLSVFKFIHYAHNVTFYIVCV